MKRIVKFILATLCTGLVTSYAADIATLTPTKDAKVLPIAKEPGLIGLVTYDLAVMSAADVAKLGPTTAMPKWEIAKLGKKTDSTTTLVGLMVKIPDGQNIISAALTPDHDLLVIAKTKAADNIYYRIGQAGLGTEIAKQTKAGGWKFEPSIQIGTMLIGKEGSSPRTTALEEVKTLDQLIPAPAGS